MKSYSIRQMAPLLAGFFASVFFSKLALGTELKAKSEIYFHSNPIGYYTDDPNVEFLRPSHWNIAPDKTFLEKTNKGLTAINMVFKPSYTESLDYVLEQKRVNPNKIFLPLPSRLDSAELFLNDFIGSAQYEIVPTPLNQSAFLYFKILVDDQQLATLQKLSMSAVTFTGNTEYTYELNGQETKSAAAINGLLTSRDFSFQKPENYGQEWLVDLFTQYEAYLPGTVDGRYSLGFLSVSISQSILTLSIKTEATQFLKEGNVVRFEPKGSNAKGYLYLEIPEFGSAVEMNLEYSLKGTLNLLNASVDVSQIQITRIETALGEADAFTMKAINKYLSQPETLQRISQELEEKLKQRILDGSLFLD